MAAALKNVYDQDFINRLSADLSQHYPAFNQPAFLAKVFNPQWPELALKARMQHISASINQCWALDFDQALAILLAIAPNYSGFSAMLFPDYVEQFGAQHWQHSVSALGEFTRHSSSEFAVRPFIVKDSKVMMQQMLSWAQHGDRDQRRLASEGCRPRLPWAMALPNFKKDPSPIIPILQQLKNDPSLYVRRSVANNLNDIAKDNPDICVQLCCDWFGQNPNTDWIVKHASRTLLKQARPELMQLFGYQNQESLKVANLNLDKTQLHIGDDLQFEFLVRNSKTAKALGKLRLEYQIDYMKSNGKTKAKKFSLGEFTVSDSEKAFQRKQSFAQMSTRKHYPGDHKLSIFVNGVALHSVDFRLLA